MSSILILRLGPDAVTSMDSNESVCSNKTKTNCELINTRVEILERGWINWNRTLFEESRKKAHAVYGKVTGPFLFHFFIRRCFCLLFLPHSTVSSFVFLHWLCRYCTSKRVKILRVVPPFTSNFLRAIMRNYYRNKKHVEPSKASLIFIFFRTFRILWVDFTVLASFRVS